MQGNSISVTCRGHQRLGLAQHLAAAPVADRNVARPSEAAATFVEQAAQSNALFVRAIGQAFDQRLGDSARRRIFLIVIDVVPEFLRLAFRGLGIGPHPGLALEKQCRLWVF
jgi:hypothetical protein